MSKPLEVTDPADAKEAAEWGKAAKHMLSGGADGESEDEAGPADDLKEFTYRGKTVKVDAETHDLLEGLRKESRSGNGRIGSELARTRERLARMEAVLAAREVKPQPEDDSDLKQLKPDPLLATRDIAAWDAQNEIYQAARERRLAERLEQKYRAEVQSRQEREAKNARDQAWADRFYDTYDHFDNPRIKPIVTQAYLDHKLEIDAYGDDVEAAHERLAELADERLLEIKRAGKSAESAQPENRRPLPRIESSASAAPRKPAEPDESRRNFSAASWVARERLKMQGREPRKER